MSKCFPMRCMGCGQLISHLYTPYLYLRQHIMEQKESHIEMNFLDHSVDHDTSILYEIFEIKGEPCQKHFLTAVLPQDMEMVGEYKIPTFNLKEMVEDPNSEESIIEDLDVESNN